MKIVDIVRDGTDSLKELLLLYAGVVLGCSALFSLFEHTGWFESLWWAVVTGLTIGYGDIYPHTVGGKLVTFLLAHIVTLLIIPLMVARMAKKAIRDRNEFTHEEQEEIKTLLREVRDAALHS